MSSPQGSVGTVHKSTPIGAMKPGPQTTKTKAPKKTTKRK